MLHWEIDNPRLIKNYLIGAYKSFCNVTLLPVGHLVHFVVSRLVVLGVGVKMVRSQKPLGTILNKHIYGKYEMFEVSGQNFKF